jgi:hypothetical protein
VVPEIYRQDGNYFLLKEDQKIELIESYKEKYALD